MMTPVTTPDSDDLHHGEEDESGGGANNVSAKRRGSAHSSPPPKMLLAQRPSEEMFAPGLHYPGEFSRRCLTGILEPMEELRETWEQELALCGYTDFNLGLEPEDLSVPSLLCPVVYTRVVGTQHDAWLVLVHSAKQPYVVVPETSPALHFLVKRAWMEYQPLSVCQRTEAKQENDGQSIDVSQNWEAFRASTLLHRWMPFAACDPPAQGECEFPEEYDDLEFAQHPTYEDARNSVPTGVSIYLPPWFRPGLGLDFDEFFNHCQQREAEETGAPNGESAPTQQMSELEARVAWETEAESSLAQAGETLYADMEILSGGTETLRGQARKKTHAWAQGIGQGLWGLFEGIGIVGPSLPSQPSGDVLPTVNPIAPTQNESPPPSPKTEKAPPERSHTVRFSDMPSVLELPKESDTTTIEEPRPEIVPMLAGRWYRMTVHEYRTWLSVSQTPMLEASLLRYLENLSTSTDPPLSLTPPEWLSDALGGRDDATHHIGRLAHGMRKRSEKWLALADAQDQFVAAVKDAQGAATPQQAKEQVTIPQHQWTRVQTALDELQKAHRACLTGQTADAKEEETKPVNGE